MKQTSKKKIIKALIETLDLNRVRIEEVTVSAINADGSPFERKCFEISSTRPPITNQPTHMKMEIIFKCPFKWKVIK